MTERTVAPRKSVNAKGVRYIVLDLDEFDFLARSGSLDETRQPLQ